METWVARMCDFAAGYEARRYRMLHPLTFANWPTLDPLRHESESNRDEEDAWKAKYGIPYFAILREAPWENDAVSLDATKIAATAAMPAGFFAAYHIYPNYPDFLNLETRFADYLADLKRYHGHQPVLVAEFGISTSRGVAHVHPEGWNHGGHDERGQGSWCHRCSARSTGRGTPAGSSSSSWTSGSRAPGRGRRWRYPGGAAPAVVRRGEPRAVVRPDRQPAGNARCGSTATRPIGHGFRRSPRRKRAARGVDRNPRAAGRPPTRGIST